MKNKNKNIKRVNAYKRMVLQLQERRVPSDSKYEIFHKIIEDAEEQKTADKLREKYFSGLKEKINHLAKILKKEHISLQGDF